MRSVQPRRIGAAAIMLTLLCGSSPGRAAGPSFSCGKASAPVDRAICGDAALSALDLALERAFRAELASDPAGRDEMLRAQRQWLRGRADACHLGKAGEPTKEQTACLAQLTTDRIAALAPRDPRDVILANAVADEIRRKGGYVGTVAPSVTAGAASLVEALGADPGSSVRFGDAEALTPSLAARLPDLSDDLRSGGAVHRLGGDPATLAVAAVEGTAHCWSIRVFREAGARYAAVPDPEPGAAEGANCGGDIGFGHTAAAGGDPELPLFADATYALDRPTLLLLALHGNRWRRVGAFALDYETALALSARSCAAGADCAALAADALDLARARDAAGADAPQRLGGATLTTTLAGDEADVLTDFGRNSFDGWSTLERDAPAYKLATAGGVVVMRVSHGTIGWRVNEDYDVAAYRNRDGIWQPVAGFQIAKTRVRLRSVTVE